MKITIKFLANNEVITVNVDSIHTLVEQFKELRMKIAMTDCKISLKDETTMYQCTVEICGVNGELLLKVIRFYFYEKAWELLQTMLAKLDTYQQLNQSKRDFQLLSELAKIFTINEEWDDSMLDSNVDYLQSLEDNIRCGQVTFKDSLTDTNVNRNRLATLLVASKLMNIQVDSDISNLESMIQVVIPDYRVNYRNYQKSLWEGLDQMLGYVNSICD